jgi:mono/diheme cytochrome c family protein
MSKLFFLLVAMAALLLQGCSDADTLGGEPPVEVTIAGEPTWDNGIGQLVQLKCATCHAIPLPPIAPDVTVTDMDLNYYPTRVVNGVAVRGGDSIGRWIAEGILDHPVQIFDATADPRKMPLDYATPVTATEKGYLLAWSEKGSPLDGASPPALGDAEAGRPFFNGTCAVCHGFQGEGKIEESNGKWRGPPIRRAAVTLAKVKSMWLTKVDPNPLSDADANNIRTHMLNIIEE